MADQFAITIMGRRREYGTVNISLAMLKQCEPEAHKDLANYTPSSVTWQDPLSQGTIDALKEWGSGMLNVGRLRQLSEADAGLLTELISFASRRNMKSLKTLVLAIGNITSELKCLPVEVQEPMLLHRLFRQRVGLDGCDDLAADTWCLDITETSLGGYEGPRQLATGKLYFQHCVNPSLFGRVCAIPIKDRADNLLRPLAPVVPAQHNLPAPITRSHGKHHTS